MLKKLLAGELSLVSTFWKFGLLGLTTLTVVVKILGKMLTRKLANHSILSYIVSSSTSPAASTIFLIILYLSALGFFLFYIYALIFGTWRSSAEYNRSLWFRYLSRIFMVIMIFIALKFVFRF